MLTVVEVVGAKQCNFSI